MILKYQTERNCINKKSVKKQKNITNREYQSEKKMKKLFLMILTAVLAFSLCGCQINGNIKNRSFLDEETPPETEKTDKSGGKTGIELWSFEIPENGDISSFLETYKDSGADYIDFRILWSSFEVEKGKYNWEFFDNIMNQITEAGYSAGVSLVFWTNGLSFKDEIEKQKTAEGEIYAFDESRTEFPSIASEENQKIMFATVQALANHVAERYSETTELWQVLISAFGDAGYSSDKDLDYGESAVSAFYKFLEEKYNTAEAFTEAYPSIYINDFANLTEMEITELTAACAYDWKEFKQKTLSDFQAEIGKIFKAADSSIPFQLFFGGIEDTKAAVYRGFYDPYSTDKIVAADIYSTTLNQDTPVTFIIDYLADTTGKKVGLTVYEEDLTEDTKNTLVAAAENGNINRICFETSEEAENIEFIKEIANAVRTADSNDNENNDANENNGDEENTNEPETVFFINTADFILRAPAENLYISLREEYLSASENGTKRVSFITDTMIADDKENTPSELTSAVSGEYYYITTTASEKLIQKNISVICPENTEIEFRDEHRKEIPEETAAVLSRLFN